MARHSRSPPFVQYFRREDNARFQKASERLDNVVRDVVQQRLEEQMKAEEDGSSLSEAREDLLSYLLLKDEDGYRLPFEYIFGNARMFLFAGHDTTAATLANALWHLAKNPQFQKRLHEEVDVMYDSTLGERTHPSYKDVKQLRYLDAVIRETLRLHPPAGIVRTSVEEIRLKNNEAGDEYVIPKDTRIYIFPFITQMMEKYWKDAKEFRPERFLESSSRSTRTRTWYPFSIGARNCVGQPLALAELKILLAHLVRRYKVEANEKATPPIQCLQLNIKPHEVLLDFIPRKR
jgi:cytochrome P450